VSVLKESRRLVRQVWDMTCSDGYGTACRLPWPPGNHHGRL